MRGAMRFLAGFAVLLAMVTGLALAARSMLSTAGQSPALHTGPTIEQVRMLSELVTTRLQIGDVQETAIDGYVGGRRVILAVKGDVLIGVDLSQARFESMNRQACTAVLVLPQPRVISARLDHEHTRVAADESEGLWTIVPGDAGRRATVNKAYAEAQAFLAHGGTDADLIAKSRRHAEQVLGSFFTATGWTVTVRWF